MRATAGFYHSRIGRRMTVDMGCVRRLILVTVGFAVLGFCVACSRQEAPKLAPAAAPPPPAPAPVVVRDAAADLVDAASDAGDARPRGHGKKAPAPPAGGGMKIEGSVPRAEGEKVVREAQPKLRACYEAASAPGKGKVSFKVTVDDRGHVTVAEIPHSTLSGGSEVETCMVRVLRDLRFPRGSGESSVSFQMSFGR